MKKRNSSYFQVLGGLHISSHRSGKCETCCCHVIVGNARKEQKEKYNINNIRQFFNSPLHMYFVVVVLLIFPLYMPLLGHPSISHVVRPTCSSARACVRGGSACEMLLFSFLILFVDCPLTQFSLLFLPSLIHFSFFTYMRIHVCFYSFGALHLYAFLCISP